MAAGKEAMGGGFGRRRGSWRAAAALLLAALLLAAPACRSLKETAGLSVVPKSLRDVPAERLAFRFEPDVAEEKLPEYLRRDEVDEPLATIRAAFETERPDDALIRTVPDPSGMRALALYGTSATDTDFRIDLYNSTGQFIRNVLPADLTGVFPEEVEWSPDGSKILFSGVRTQTPQATPEPLNAAPVPPDLSQPPAPRARTDAEPGPTAAPIIPSAQTFRTEQVYVGDRDGYNLRPLTAREGLIYFKLVWSPDGQAVAALACKEDEWAAQRREGFPHAGRPRLITLEGQERLLDDRATPVEPAWSPDGSKLATAFEYDVAVYDAGGAQPSGAGLSAARAPARRLRRIRRARLQEGRARRAAAATSTAAERDRAHLDEPPRPARMGRARDGLRADGLRAHLPRRAGLQVPALARPARLAAGGRARPAPASRRQEEEPLYGLPQRPRNLRTHRRARARACSPPSRV